MTDPQQEYVVRLTAGELDGIRRADRWITTGLLAAKLAAAPTVEEAVERMAKHDYRHNGLWMTSGIAWQDTTDDVRESYRSDARAALDSLKGKNDG